MRIVGCRASMAMASTSAVSFLPLLRNGKTNSAAISRAFGRALQTSDPNDGPNHTLPWRHCSLAIVLPTARMLRA
jgi:hypothetical protein